MSRLGNLLSIVFLIAVFVECSQATLIAKEKNVSEAMIDLSGWEVSEGIVNLNGVWDLYWNQLVAPEQINGLQEKPLKVHVPSVWRSANTEKQPLSNMGYGTYRLRMILPADEPSQPLALYVGGVATSYRLWINGELHAVNGAVGTSLQTMVPYNLPKVITFVPQPGSNELVMQVSNFVQRKGGIWEPVRLGSTEQIRAEQLFSFASEVFIIGCLIVMGLYHLGLYVGRRKELSALYFGGLCLAVAVRTSVLGEAVLLNLFPSLSWEWAVKLEYGSIFVGMHMLTIFVYKEYLDMKGLMVKISAVIHSSLILLILLAPARIYTHLMLPYQLLVIAPVLTVLLIIFLRTALKRKIDSIINMVGFIFFSTAIIADILFYNHLIPYGDFAPYGLLILLFSQSIHLSLKFSHTAEKAERLSVELIVANETLEQKIKERTIELRRSNEELSRINDQLFRNEQFRRQLLSSISHELGTPLTAIRALSSAVADGLVEQDYKKYAKRIYERTELLERLINDLVELTKLETELTSFQFQKVDITSFFHHLYSCYEMDMLERAAQFTWESPTYKELKEKGTAFASMDIHRMEQVIVNILSNAKKFIPDEGIIEMKVELCEHDLGTAEAVVSITNNGPLVPENELEAIFERFYRSKESKHAIKGSGLGLSICKEIVRSHQGSIAAKNIPCIGFCIYFTIPVWFEREEGMENDEHFAGGR
ncbi:sensor histidine kinase [Ammoniphilus resinae]|uniref:histidine kinase n=1 Tax=Ammoniphilus resinae TaxID=861532 RepID=A0ABS4GS16_9BACL|nr:sensor histidine kinase [Ammoniphilus resinae]MBP1932922.1 signal transduction histidine kinase [Ammoniphilus resinae]